MARQITRRAFAFGASATVAGVGLGAGEQVIASPALADDLTKALSNFVRRMSPANRRRAMHQINDRRREDWHYVPRSRPGVRIDQLSGAGQRALWDVLGVLMSARGVSQVKGTIELEGILGDLTGNRSFRDPGNYVFILFGDPNATGPTAFRFEGHHLSVNALVVKGHGVAVTPVFFGANPAKVPSRHHHKGFRLLGSEEDAAFQLVRSLEGAARQKAIIADRAPRDVIAGPGREDSLKTFAGQPLSGLSEGQMAGVYRITDLFVGTMSDRIATEITARVRNDGADKLHFAWAGSLVPGRPHYFRIHGPSILVEYDNTQNGANHVHALWLDPREMFGRDLLAKHHRRAH